MVCPACIINSGRDWRRGRQQEIRRFLRVLLSGRGFKKRLRSFSSHKLPSKHSGPLNREVAANFVEWRSRVKRVVVMVRVEDSLTAGCNDTDLSL